MFASLPELLESTILEWELIFRVHATQKMFQLDIEETDIVNVLEKGISLNHIKMTFHSRAS